MNTDKIIAIFLTVLMVGSVFGLAQPVAAGSSAQASPTISLQPADVEVQTGDEQTFEVVVEGIDDGVGAYEFTVELSDGSAATFTGATNGLNGDGAGSTTVNDGSVTVSHSYFNDGAASGDAIATVTLQAADSAGSTDVTFGDVRVDAEGGSSYDTTNEGASLTVNDEPPRDVSDSDVLSVSIPEEDSTIVSRPAQHFTEADFDQSDIQLLSEGAVTQEVNAVLDIDGNSGTETLIIDFSESEEAGLAVPDLDDPAGTIIGSGPLQGAVENVEVRNAVGEVEITYDTSATGEVVEGTQTFNVAFVNNGFIGSGADGSLTHTVLIDNVANSDASARFRATDRGATAVAPEDAQFDLSRDNGPVAENVEPRRNGGTGAFDIWQGQQVSFQTAEAGNTVEIYEYETESGAGDADVVRRGAQVTRVGTAPGSTTNLDTSELEAGQRYIVDFVDFDGYAADEAPTVIFDVDPLNLQAEASADEFQVNQPVQVDVTADDISGGDVTVAFFDENFENVLEVVNDQLDGDGETSVQVNATDDLEGIDDYNAIVTHDQSEVSTAPITFSVVEAPDEEVTIASPTPGDDQFTRGDIIPIELEFTNTDTGTLTFGDRTDPQNLEVSVTVRDANGDGTATVYLNTFQIGDGAYTSTVADEGSGEPLAEGESCEARGVAVDDCDTLINTEDNRNHGFFTHPDDDGSALVGPEGAQAVAHGPSLDIRGGSTGGSIVFPQGYDLRTTSGTDSVNDEDQFLNDNSILRIQEASTEGITTWTAPGIGDNEIEPELASEVTGAIEDGIITPSDGEIASQDFYVLQLEASGLEGLFHEAVLQDSDLDVDDFLPAPGESRAEDLGDELVTEEFFAAQNLTSRSGDPLLDFSISTRETFQSVDNRTSPNVALDPVILAIEDATTGVVAATDDSGNLNEFFIPLRLTPGTDLTRAGTINYDLDDDDEIEESIDASGEAELVPGLDFESTFSLDPTDADQRNVVANDPLGNGFAQVNQWDYIPASAQIDNADPLLVVPQEEGVEISGTTKVAAGTNLTINLATAPAEDPPFFKQNPAVFPEYNPEGDNTFSITEDFADFDVGTEFDVTIRRAGAAGILTEDVDADGEGEPVDGIVGEVRAVGEFTFNDQRSGGSSVLVENFQAPYNSIIEIVDSNGNRLGLSEVIPGSDSPQTRIAIPLNEDISENQEVTARAWLAQDGQPVQQYTQDGEPVTRTAQITVRDPLPADFTVSNLDPTNAELDEPTDVTVSATITNEGDQEDTQVVALVVDGSDVGSQEITLAGGESTTVEFDLPASAQSFGTTFVHSIESEDDAATSTLTIAPEPTPEPTPTPTDTPEPMTDTPTDTPEDGGDGAGFGIVVAMLAFLGAALLAVRRRTDE